LPIIGLAAWGSDAENWLDLHEITGADSSSCCFLTPRDERKGRVVTAPR